MKENAPSIMLIEILMWIGQATQQKNKEKEKK